MSIAAVKKKEIPKCDVEFLVALKIGKEKLAIGVKLPGIFGQVILALMRQVAKLLVGLK